MPQRRTHRSMSGMQLLKKASDGFRRVVNNGKKMSGLFGETDDGTRTITINKALIKKKEGGHIIKKPDGSESLIGTIVHEELHAAHPKAHEKTVRKAAKRKIKTIPKKTKQRLYSRYRGA